MIHECQKCYSLWNDESVKECPICKYGWHDKMMKKKSPLNRRINNIKKKKYERTDNT